MTLLGPSFYDGEITVEKFSYDELLWAGPAELLQMLAV